MTAEIPKATGPNDVEMIRQLSEQSFYGDAIPTDWEESIILNLFRGRSRQRPEAY